MSKDPFAVIRYSTRTAFLIGEPPGSDAKLLAKRTVPLNDKDFATARVYAADVPVLARFRWAFGK